GIVHFTSTDGAAVLPANYTFLAADAGTQTFNATLKTVGERTITATDTVTEIGRATWRDRMETPAAASTLVVSGFADPTVAGVQHSSSVDDRYAYCSPATGYTGIVHFTSTDGAAVLPANYTFLAADAGTQTFNATLKTVGERTITATDTVTATITDRKTTRPNSSHASSTHAVFCFAKPTVAGVQHSLTLQARDASGIPYTALFRSVHFTSTDGAAVLPANYTFLAADAGTQTFNATLKTVGERTITATDTVTATI